VLSRHWLPNVCSFQALVPAFDGGDGNALLTQFIGRARRARCSSRSPVAVREQAFLVVVELLGCLGRELEVWSQDDGVDWAGLFTEAAVDAFHHVDIVAGGALRAVVAPRPGPRW
jgi:hypothetical protein